MVPRPFLLPLFTNVVEKLSKKGFEQRSKHEFGRYTEHEIGQKEPFGSLWGYAANTSETFRTVSEGAFSEVHLQDPA
jgi:hypothetical protein